MSQPIQMQLSKKTKSFSEFFAAFLKFTFNFKYLEIKDDPHSLSISELKDCEVRGSTNV